MYDRFGESALKNGYQGPDGVQSYKFSGDPLELFENFFGSDNPFTVALDANGKQVKLIEKIECDIHKDAITERAQTHTKDLEVECECTLEEFFYGCQKTVEFTRNMVFSDGKTEYMVPKVCKEIEVKPGMKDGTQLRFKDEGSQEVYKHFGDLVVTLRQKEHAKFVRNGNDLILRHEIDLFDALLAEGVEIQTIDGETIKFRSEQIITPKTTKIFKGKGMPIYSADPLAPLMMNHSRGNLVLKF